MNIKKNCGIVLIVLGMILTLDRTNEFKGIVSIIVYYIKNTGLYSLLFAVFHCLLHHKKLKRNEIKNTDFI